MATKDLESDKLWLKRNNHWNEWYKDHSDGTLIGPGEYYYEYVDDEGKQRRISCLNYWKLKKDYMDNNNPYENMLAAAESQTEYKKQLEETEAEYIKSKILDRDIGYKTLR